MWAGLGIGVGVQEVSLVLVCDGTVAPALEMVDIPSPGQWEKETRDCLP
jgi:hypothetical protein